MKIVYLFNSSIPSYNANSLQVVNMCNELSVCGNDVTLITPNTGLKKSISEHYGIKKSFNLIKIKKFKKFPRGLNYYLYSFLSVIRGNKIHPEIFITRNYFTLFLLILLRKKIIFEIHSDLKSEGRINNFIYSKFNLLSSKRIVNLVFITNSLKKHFCKTYNLNLNKSSVLSSASNIKNNRPSLVRNESINIGYFGLVNNSRGFDFICKLSKIDMFNKYYIYGGTNELINSIKKKMNNKNLFINSYIPYRKIKDLMKEMDILILPYENVVTAAGNVGNISKYTSPMKLFDYLASGKVIIASSLLVLKEVLKENKNCIFVDNLNIFEWKKEITKLKYNLNKMHIISMNNHFLSKKFTYRNRIKNLLQ
jgi:glycosyltransferase involved in cell wall biosynthesis